MKLGYRVKKTFCTLGLLNTLVGCAVGPDFVRPADPKMKGYSSDILAQSDDQHVKLASDIPRQWWTLFHSEALNNLIQQAFKENPTLKSAQAALRVAQENVYAQAAASYPLVTAGYASSREKDATGSITSNAASGASLFNLHTTQLTIGYTADVFGVNRKQVESLEAQAEIQRFQVRAAYITLASDIASSAIQEAGLREQIEITQHIVSINEEQLELLKKQLTLGAISEATVMIQESSLLQAQATLSQLQKQLAQQRDLLAALAGSFPDAPLPEFKLATFQLPRDLPVSLPSKLVRQRPDVCAAEAQLRSANAQIGVAIANRWPQFTLTASSGSMATQFSDLLMGGNGFWAVAGGLTQPIFDAGALRHKQKSAEAAYAQVAEQYQNTVITALQNVVDTLQALKYDARAFEQTAINQKITETNSDIAQRQEKLGDTSHVLTLNAELAVQQVRISKVQAEVNRYTDTVALFQALGGGWWNK